MKKGLLTPAKARPPRHCRDLRAMPARDFAPQQAAQQFAHFTAVEEILRLRPLRTLLESFSFRSNLVQPGLVGGVSGAAVIGV